MADAARVLASTQDAPWLPPGGRADVVLAAAGEDPPEPTCLVRLLVVRDGAVLVVARPDRGGLDLPTRRVGDESPDEALRALASQTPVVAAETVLLGYVRNVVETPADGYLWPAPEAHFAVWVSDLEAGRGRRAETAAATRRAQTARWLDRHEAEEYLGERHWWPLAAAYLAGRGGPTTSG
jgi:hypothetical protein